MNNTVDHADGQEQSLVHPRRRLTKHRSEAVKEPSPVAKAPLEYHASEQHRGRPPPVVDPRTILHLMRTTRGRMQGELLYRQVGNSPWCKSDCYIDADSGSLCSSVKDDLHGGEPCLFKDLRQCRAQALLHEQSRYTVLQLVAANEIETLELRTTEPKYFNAWFAAFLCWSSVPVGQRFTEGRGQLRPNLVRQVPDFLPKVDSGPIENPIRKVGAAIYIDFDGNQPVQPLQRDLAVEATQRIGVSCVLNAKGELNLLSKDLQPIASVHLPELPRSAIQRLAPNVLEADCLVAIYPQYSQSTTACSQLRPIYLAFESDELFEGWFVVFRAHAIPELYGASRTQPTEPLLDSGALPGLEPAPAPIHFRIERSLHFRLNKARLWDNAKPRFDDETAQSSGNTTSRKQNPADFFVELLLDGQIRGKSKAQRHTFEPVWNEEFYFDDLASRSSSIAVRVKKQECQLPVSDTAIMSAAPIPGVPPPHMQRNRQRVVSRSTNPSVAHGEASIETSMLVNGVDVESWYPLIDDYGAIVGEVSVEVRQEEDIVLMKHEYDRLSERLHDFPKFLTLKIFDWIPTALNRLSECFLNIFQASGKAREWLVSLAEEEIDGVRELPQGRTHVTRRLVSTESLESQAAVRGHREDVVRELNKSALEESHLLFRGNSLLSKSLDRYMQRVGLTYLRQTIAGYLEQIAAEDANCEVDPARIVDGQDIQKSWKRILTHVEQLWERIRHSAPQCPAELRVIFRRIGSCADVRFGGHLRTVRYSSISSFLFLRFFCPAILNPPIFGLLDAPIGSSTKRTFLLISKTLNGLASMNMFGVKEPWMEPMNKFLSANRQAFKDFIDEIINIPVDEPTNNVPTSHYTTFMILDMLPRAAREGLPRLPYLIDRARNLAALVDIIWSERHSLKNLHATLPDDLICISNICLDLHELTRSAWQAADRGERVRSSSTHRWIRTAEQMELHPERFWGRASSAQPRTTSVESMPSPISSPRARATDKGKGKGKLNTALADVRSPSSRHHKQINSSTPTTPTALPISSKQQSRDPIQRLPSRFRNMGTTRTVASAAQLIGAGPVVDASLDSSSAPSSGDEMDLPVALRKLEHAAPRSEAGSERRLARGPYTDLTLTPETIHSRALRLGLGDEKKSDAVSGGELTSDGGRKEKRSFWRRKRSNMKTDEGSDTE